MPAPKSRASLTRSSRTPRRPQTSGGSSKYRGIFKPGAKLDPSQVVDVRGRTARKSGHPTRPTVSYRPVKRSK